jgi:hypothetical protein
MALAETMIVVLVAITLLVPTSPADRVVPISRLPPNCPSVPKPSV